MTQKRTIVDFHIIQSLPSNNINRDMSGLPKSCLYGGVQRARVSSQAWKRAMREYFADHEDLGLGTRTRQIADVIADMLVESKKMKRDVAHAQTVRVFSFKSNVALPIDPKKGALKSVAFFSRYQLEQLADLVWKASKSKSMSDDMKRECGEAIAVVMRDKTLMDADIALFGRMIAGDHESAVEAASSHMHSISTHEVEIESDEFTTVDDHTGTTGSAHLGNHEHQSATLYRFATIDVDELARSVGAERAVDAVSAFAKAFVHSVPKGRSTTFFASTPPSFVVISVREDRPQPYVVAFESPVVSAGVGYIGESVTKFVEYAGMLTQNLDDKPVHTRFMSMVTEGHGLPGAQDSLNGIIEGTAHEVSSRLGVK